MATKTLSQSVFVLLVLVALFGARVPATGLHGSCGLDLVGLDALRLGLEIDLARGLPHVARLAIPEAPLTFDGVRILRAFLGVANVVEVAMPRAIRRWAHHANPMLDPLVAQQIALGLARQLTPRVASHRTPCALELAAILDQMEVA